MLKLPQRLKLSCCERCKSRLPLQQRLHRAGRRKLHRVPDGKIQGQHRERNVYELPKPYIDAGESED